ncbi:uncharacterized protein LOC117102833 isoform X3 [Anneissia japonica]|uniref:uncharacterized protein LOC117102833 isoform X3 n=1 Tax=Anneissia japonica TaxID=1529436 RepID=UPI00142571C4|nr:uncharacterized protein LOC117102833 isoform X3 [Anneissia japonica]
MNEKAVEGISDDTYKYILATTSQWYDKRMSINMLKVLYRDQIKNASDLDSALKTSDVLALLNSSGHLSPTDLTILYDTIKVTHQFGLEDEIKHKIKSFPNVRNIKISKFTIHRQKLMNLGMALIQDDIPKIDGLYNSPLLGYASSWNLIIDLEHKGKIREEEMEPFIEKLKELELYQAAKTLQSVPKEVSTANKVRPTLEVAGYSKIDEKKEQKKTEVQPPSGTDSKNDDKEKNTKGHPTSDTGPEAVIIALDVDQIDEAKQRGFLASWKKNNGNNSNHGYCNWNLYCRRS